MTDETKIVLVLGGISILLCCWAYYHCLMRQHEKYNNLKKAFEEDFPNTWGKPFKSMFPIEGDIPGVSKELQDKAWDEYKKTKPKRPRLYKQATVVTKGELPKTTERKKTVAKNGLYANIHAKQERIEKQKAAGGKVETMRKPGTKGAPTAKAFKESAKTAKAKK